MSDEINWDGSDSMIFNVTYEGSVAEVRVRFFEPTAALAALAKLGSQESLSRLASEMDDFYGDDEDD